MARLLLALAAAAAVRANDEGYDPRAVAEEVLEPGFGVVNGDMLLECGSAAELGLDAIGCGGMKNLLTSRGVFRQTYRRWTRVRRNGEYVGAIVPYTIDPAFGENEVRGIESALARLNELTKIVSVEPYNKRVHGAEAPILNFVKASYCASFIGNVKTNNVQNGKQSVWLSNGCARSKRVVQHEVMHALGFFHEQSRPDRDDYVNVLWENIKDDMESNFKKQQTNVDSLGVPYDYRSILHYQDYLFNTGKGKKTMTKPDGSPIPGPADEATSSDILQIHLMYMCTDRMLQADEFSEQMCLYDENCLCLVDPTTPPPTTTTMPPEDEPRGACAEDECAWISPWEKRQACTIQCRSEYPGGCNRRCKRQCRRRCKRQHPATYEPIDPNAQCTCEPPLEASAPSGQCSPGDCVWRSYWTARKKCRRACRRTGEKTDQECKEVCDSEEEEGFYPVEDAKCSCEDVTRDVAALPECSVDACRTLTTQQNDQIGACFESCSGTPNPEECNTRCRDEAKGLFQLDGCTCYLPVGW